MTKSKNQGVQELLDDIKELEPEKFEIMQSLRELVFKTYPQVTERIMYGGIMFTLEEDFGGLFPSKKHVSFEFSRGFSLEDPQGLLEGKGKIRRHLKFKSLGDLTTKNPLKFVEQVNDL